MADHSLPVSVGIPFTKNSHSDSKFQDSWSNSLLVIADQHTKQYPFLQIRLNHSQSLVSTPLPTAGKDENHLLKITLLVLEKWVNNNSMNTYTRELFI